MSQSGFSAGLGARRAVDVHDLPARAPSRVIALALADPKRRVVSYDPIARGERERYLDLAGASVNERIEQLQGDGLGGQIARGVVADAPVRHQQRAGAGIEEGPRQAGQALRVG